MGPKRSEIDIETACEIDSEVLRENNGEIDIRSGIDREAAAEIDFEIDNEVDTY